MLNRVLLPLIAAIFLSTLLVQQIALQDISKNLQSPTATTAGDPSSCLNVGFPCVTISYHGWVYSEFGRCTASTRGSPGCYPQSGYVFLILLVSFWNNGYDTAPTGLHPPELRLNYLSYSYFHLAVDESSQYDPIYLSCMDSSVLLPITEVPNGLTVHGWLAFEIPSNFRSYSLIYEPQTGSYNVLYSNEGYSYPSPLKF